MTWTGAVKIGVESHQRTQASPTRNDTSSPISTSTAYAKRGSAGRGTLGGEDPLAMDEVENPNLPAAGEASPTLRPTIGDYDDLAPHDATATSPNRLPTRQAVASEFPGQVLPKPFSTRATVPIRPGLVRENSAPPPQPPPAPPSQTAEFIGSHQENPDSLTLADLKRLRSSFPNAPTPSKQELSELEKVYDFDYQDAQSLPVELQEWFTYSDLEAQRLQKCKSIFTEAVRATEYGRTDWMDLLEDTRRKFVTKEIEELRISNGRATNSLLILTYLGLGVWEETAGRQEGCSLDGLFPRSNGGGSRLDDFQSSSLQLQWIVAMVDTLHSCDGLNVIYNALRTNFEDSFASSAADPPRIDAAPKRPDESIELWCCLTLMYLFVEIARTTTGQSGRSLKRDILALQPTLLHYLTQMVAKLRWDDGAPVPLTKMLLVAWKTILVSFGGIGEVEKVKDSLREKKEDEFDARGQPVITTSPLDYHLFRQEIGSKYPAYQPPAPLFPLEPENNSILPPLRHRIATQVHPDTGYTGAPNVGTHSIMHQPVHIATPAPSPPPSPAGPGKAGKKQNYQTNQMFPFLYPPLESDSNDLGGKGSTELQDALVGRRWEGSDVPSSILEAAELFAKRMRATRAMKQLWEVRVDYMKYERGWKTADDDENTDVDDFELIPKLDKEETAPQGLPVSQTHEEAVLTAVSVYYRDALPYLQSVVIVLLKAVLQHVTDLVTKGNGQNGLQASIQFNDPIAVNGSGRPLENGVDDVLENTAEEIDKLRSQEIAAKALTAILLLLLKWFKVSHVLQYEYITQLLLDSNYVPLVLKLWQTQEIGRACHYQTEREESNFFYFCQAHSRQGAPKIKDPLVDDSDSDDAAPPPIKKRRDEPASDASQSPSLQAALDFQHPPEVDELGYPQTPMPTTPLKAYSYRNVFSAINYLRILQKVTRRKTHRSLLLVSYKSSNHLKKTLRIPVRMLRYYTLKLFKSQVPFCGRKWRQGNMKIITAVWLSVPAELRDDWLSGGGGGMGGACAGDVDGTVEDAVPLEQSLRNLTHWWNVRNFPEVMGAEKGVLKEEMDYFTRELEKMEGFLRDEDALGDEQADGMDGGEGWQGPIEGY